MRDNHESQKTKHHIAVAKTPIFERLEMVS